MKNITKFSIFYPFKPNSVYKTALKVSTVLIYVQGVQNKTPCPLISQKRKKFKYNFFLNLFEYLLFYSCHVYGMFSFSDPGINFLIVNATPCTFMRSWILHKILESEKLIT